MFWIKQRQIILLFILMVSGGISPHYSYAGNPVYVDMGAIIIAKGTKVGEPISGWVATNTVNTFNFCGEGAVNVSIGALGLNSGVIYDGNIVFDTHLAGIGYVLGAKAGLDGPPHGDWHIIQSRSRIAVLLDTVSTAGCHSIYNDVMVRLVKTGSIEGGALTGRIGLIQLGKSDVYVGDSSVYFDGSIVTSSCLVTTPNITVPLGRHKKSIFTSVGSTTEWQNFTIGLDCDPNVNINVQINAEPDPNTSPGIAVMRLDDPAGDTTAKGVGIELLYQDHIPLFLNQSSEYKTTLRSGPELIKLKARYYQTLPNVTPGIANGTATFTLTYK
ncbi:fimbrial protein [Enterobacter wuhouensis]|uniref:fimbrial protein n=1 Tax=Enterobacter wuhouensis TaxID=2529381 RepID=UPI002FCF60F9